VNQTPDGKGDFIETLSYLPDPSHNGQSLQCVLEQMGYTNQQIEAAANIARLELELLCKSIFKRYQGSISPTFYAQHSNVHCTYVSFARSFFVLTF
jgi:hypothetical protein